MPWYTVRTHSQGVFPLREALAELLGADKEMVHCVHVEGSGCYGHNAADDVAADAAPVGARLPGRPVRVQWIGDGLGRGDKRRMYDEPCRAPGDFRLICRI